MRGRIGRVAIMFALAASLAANIGTSCQAQVSSPTNTHSLSQIAKRAVIEKAGALLTANYIYPDRAAEAKAKLDAALIAGEYDSITTPETLAKKITHDLQSATQDKHLLVLPPPAPRPPASATSAAAPAVERSYDGFSRVDLLKGNIGFIKLLNFPVRSGPFEQTATQAMKDIAGTDALIIDMRDNRGGDPVGVNFLSSFFFDPKTPVHIDGEVDRKPGTNEFQSKEFYTSPVSFPYLNKPVYVLTSRRTVSAGEMFVYILKTQSRARLIGEVSEGSANGAATHELPSDFTIVIPFTRVVNPVTKSNFEGVGVKPDLAVDESLAFQAAMREIVARSPARDTTLKAKVESQITEESFVEAHLLRYRDQPQPGGADAMRRLFTGIASGKPDYAKMSDEVAQMVRGDFAFFHNDMKRLGDVKSVTFIDIDTRGLDEYEIRTATFTERFGIYLGPDGKIAVARFQPPIPLPTQP